MLKKNGTQKAHEKYNEYRKRALELVPHPSTHRSSTEKPIHDAEILHRSDSLFQIMAITIKTMIITPATLIVVDSLDPQIRNPLLGIRFYVPFQQQVVQQNNPQQILNTDKPCQQLLAFYLYAERFLLDWLLY